MNRMFGTIDLGARLTLEDLKEIHKSPEVHRAWEIANKKYGEEVEQKIEEIKHKIKVTTARIDYNQCLIDSTKPKGGKR